MTAPEALRYENASLRSRAIRSGMFLAFRAGAGMLLSLGGILLLTRRIGSSAYGAYAGALGILTFLQSLAQWGVSTYLLRAESSELERTSAVALAVTLLAAIASVVVGMASLPLLARWISIPDFPKVAGILFLRAANGQHLIVRTSWVYANRGRNFLCTILRLSREREGLRVVDDQIGTPTPARLVAEVTAHLVSRAPEALTGTYHVATRGSTSWFGFAKAILELDAPRAEQRCEGIVPIASNGFPALARRPGFSALDTGKVESSFGLRMPAWQDALALVMEKEERVMTSEVCLGSEFRGASC
jgi:hypothetical protein